MYYNQKNMDLEQFQKILLGNCAVQKDVPLVVGFSGGPDSLCLLDSLARLSFQVIAAHFDHRLRPESASEAESAREAAARLNVPFVSQAGDVAAFARDERISIEEAARTLRYQFLFTQARHLSAQAVAVGHTADDQVETLLMHLLRGTGLAGLTGMAFRSTMPEWDPEIPVVRPLLPYWREDILACCRERGLTATIDPSNLETAYFRNRLRHELVPYLEKYNPQARKALWRTAQILSADAEVLLAAAQQALSDCQVRYEVSDDGQPLAAALRLDCFQGLSLGLKRAVLRQVAAHLLPGPRDLDFAAVERCVEWAADPGSGQVDLTQGMRLFVESGWIWITRGEAPRTGWPQIGEEPLDLPVPGEVEVAPGWRLSSEWVLPGQAPQQPDPQLSAWEAWLDSDTLPGPLYLRRPQPGDRFQPLGMPEGSQKISDFMVNNKLPRRARAAWPLVAAADEIVWVPGFRLAHPYRLRPGTQRVLHLRMLRA